MWSNYIYRSACAWNGCTPQSFFLATRQTRNETVSRMYDTLISRLRARPHLPGGDKITKTIMSPRGTRLTANVFFFGGGVSEQAASATQLEKAGPFV